MGGPAWLTAIFAAASLAVAIYCAGRLVVARRAHRPTELDTDGAHVIMGVAMAGMLISGLRTIGGSPVGSPSRLHEMLEVAARHGVKAITEPFAMAKANDAIAKVKKGKVRYRAVLAN